MTRDTIAQAKKKLQVSNLKYFFFLKDLKLLLYIKGSNH